MATAEFLGDLVMLAGIEGLNSLFINVADCSLPLYIMHKHW